MKITSNRSVKKLFLSQQAYVEKVVKRFNMNNAKPVTVLFAAHFKLSVDMSPKIDEEMEHIYSVPYLSHHRDMEMGSSYYGNHLALMVKTVVFSEKTLFWLLLLIGSLNNCVTANPEAHKANMPGYNRVMYRATNPSNPTPVRAVEVDSAQGLAATTTAIVFPWSHSEQHHEQDDDQQKNDSIASPFPGILLVNSRRM
ncbi:hypothetical protein GH714_040013 [Hevea brasiliensis]|uniref:Reverse transcriptase Ty1/copia-type domain-containing protein n=1 Tax=Hevea brasiliensis TaxID=3981 RepID=A0A6A6M8Q2_HEVBR|nr:hypothetical protein GH714_040013 [Hevea brasiliensis]